MEEGMRGMEEGQEGQGGGWGQTEEGCLCYNFQFLQVYNCMFMNLNKTFWLESRAEHAGFKVAWE